MIVSEQLHNHTERFIADNVLTVWSHRNTDREFISDLLDSTQELVDFTIRRVKRRSKAEIRFLETSVIVSEHPNTIGLAVPTEKGYDLLIKKEIAHLKRWVYAHEWGHALGLAHPHDVGWDNSTTNDSVMSYTYLPSSRWFFRPTDVDTITGLYKQ